MKVFMVYWHAEPQSFNGALFQTAQETLTALGHDVRMSDLYDMRFDPVSDRRNFTSVKDATYFNQQVEEMHASAVGGFAADIEAEMQKLEWGELMLWQFPLWWFGLPAVFKGWVDRVFAMGRTYGGDRRFETGVFRGKQAMLSVTTGGPGGSLPSRGLRRDHGRVAPHAPGVVVRWLRRARPPCSLRPRTADRRASAGGIGGVSATAATVAP
jgi:putative NADPH-quinone reductase